MKMEFGKSYREIKTVFIIILILTFIFGFNDNKQEFILKDWILNLIYVFSLVSMVVLFNVLGYKLAAKYFDVEIETKMWNSHFFVENFKFKNLRNYIFSPVLGILTTLFSNGKLFFTASTTFEIKNYNNYGKKFPKVSYINSAFIVTFGLFFNLVLMIIFKILSIDKGMTINMWFILWHLLPFSELPGAKVFIASVKTYLFVLIFFILNIFIIQSMSIISTLIISSFISILIAVIYFYFVDYLKS